MRLGLAVTCAVTLRWERRPLHFFRGNAHIVCLELQLVVWRCAQFAKSLDLEISQRVQATVYADDEINTFVYSSIITTIKQMGCMLIVDMQQINRGRAGADGS